MHIIRSTNTTSKYIKANTLQNFKTARLDQLDNKQLSACVGLCFPISLPKSL